MNIFDRIKELIQHPLLTWWRIDWTESSTKGEAKAKIRTAYQHPPRTDQELSLIRQTAEKLDKIADTFGVDITWFQCQDEDLIGETYTSYWDDEQHFTAWGF